MLKLNDLPNELLHLITERLDSRTEVLLFRAACRSFFSSVPFPPKAVSPFEDLKIPIPGGPIPFSSPDPIPNSARKLLLTQSTIYALEPVNKISDALNTTKTWFVKVEESSSGKVHVQDPFYRITFRDLSRKLPKSLNLLDYRVKEVSKVFGLKNVHVLEDGKCKELDEFQYPFFRKVAFSSGIEDIKDGFTVMAIHTRGVLSVWRKGDEHWRKINAGSQVSFEDVIFHHGKFYALTSKGVTISIDSASLKFTEVSSPIARSHFKYLVKSSKDLYLVEKHLMDVHFSFGYEDYYQDYDDYPLHLNVFKLDVENRCWVKVMKGLDEGVIFCSFDGSFAVSGEEFPGFKSNCVYFPHESFSRRRDDHPGWEGGILDLEHDTLGSLRDFPGYSKVFWPPPTWLKHKCA